MTDELRPDLSLLVSNVGRQQSGFTLIEVAVSVVLLSILLGLAFNVTMSSQDHMLDEMNLLALESTLSRTVDRMAAELTEASPTSVSPSILDGSDNVTFNKVTGYSLGAVQLGPAHKFELQMSSGETLNGSDDNGDGLVDEGVVVFTMDGEATTIADNVLSLSFTGTGTAIEYTVEVGAVLQIGEVVTRSSTRTVSFRN